MEEKERERFHSGGEKLVVVKTRESPEIGQFGDLVPNRRGTKAALKKMMR